MLQTRCGCTQAGSAFDLQLLGAYLPGPLNVVKDVLLTKQDEPQVGHSHCCRRQQVLLCQRLSVSA